MSNKLLVLLLLFWNGSACTQAEVRGQAIAPSAPPRTCEIKQAVWCIDGEVHEITSTIPEKQKYIRQWIVRGAFRPESELVVLEPEGCRKGKSDRLELEGYEEDIRFKGELWDRMSVKLKSDGSCNLDLYMHPFDGDQMEWAFSTGLMLIRPCQDDKCLGESIGALAPKVRDKFRRAFRPTR